MAAGSFEIRSEQNIVYVVLDGVFSLNDVKLYEKALQKHVFQFHPEIWLLVADVNLLQPSPMEAVKYTENITNWILENGCQGIINVHNLNESIVDFQLAIAAGGNKIINAKTAEEAEKLIIELNKLLEKAG